MSSLFLEHSCAWYSASCLQLPSHHQDGAEGDGNSLDSQRLKHVSIILHSRICQPQIQAHSAFCKPAPFLFSSDLVPIFKILFCCSIVGLLRCVNYCCTAPLFSHAHVYMYPLYIPFLLVYLRILTTVPCAMQKGLDVYAFHNSSYLLISNSRSTPAPLPEDRFPINSSPHPRTGDQGSYFLDHPRAVSPPCFSSSFFLCLKPLPPCLLPGELFILK